MMKEPKKCKVCGAEFIPHGRAVTCSPACSKKNRANISAAFIKAHYTGKRPPIIRTCVICGHEYRAKGRDVTCGGECAKVNRKKVNAASHRERHQRLKGAEVPEPADRIEEERMARSFLACDIKAKFYGRAVA